MGHRIPLARMIYARLRCNVFMLEYRGCVFLSFLRFSLSSACPSCLELMRDKMVGMGYQKA